MYLIFYITLFALRKLSNFYFTFCPKFNIYLGQYISHNV